MTLRADIVAYRSSASAEGEEETEALNRVDDLMDRILYETRADSYKAFLSGEENFRYKVYPEYKANRTKPKPIHLLACRKHLVKYWNAELVDGYEADDALGWSQTNKTVICSIDKDLRQIPGQHYNFVKGVWSEIDGYTGMFNFYRQFLIGDTSDNIIGIKGLGPAKTEKILYGLTEEEMFDKIRELYNDDKRFLINGLCLYILREKGKYWSPIKLEQEVLSILTTQIPNISTENTNMQVEV